MKNFQEPFTPTCTIKKETITFKLIVINNFSHFFFLTNELQIMVEKNWDIFSKVMKNFPNFQ